MNCWNKFKSSKLRTKRPKNCMHQRHHLILVQMLKIRKLILHNLKKKNRLKDSRVESYIWRPQTPISLMTRTCFNRKWSSSLIGNLKLLGWERKWKKRKCTIISYKIKLSFSELLKKSQRDWNGPNLRNQTWQVWVGPKKMLRISSMVLRDIDEIQNQENQEKINIWLAKPLRKKDFDSWRVYDQMILISLELVIS